MMVHYLTADSHFGDDQIRRFFARPFATVQEMDAAMLTACHVITPDDDLWIIGDFACSDTEAQQADAATTFQALLGAGT
ncbi:hypothetical protein ACEUZ9_005367 [Paracoccus litorisediminis]|uniref:hypothetical protein n=1 Tax=Paracoccus litorisediminis TaxID=2006130 RepID=UPI00372E4041